MRARLKLSRVDHETGLRDEVLKEGQGACAPTWHVYALHVCRKFQFQVKIFSRCSIFMNYDLSCISTGYVARFRHRSLYRKASKRKHAEQSSNEYLSWRTVAASCQLYFYVSEHVRTRFVRRNAQTITPFRLQQARSRNAF